MRNAEQLPSAIKNAFTTISKSDCLWVVSCVWIYALIYWIAIESYNTYIELLKEGKIANQDVLPTGIIDIAE